MLFFIRILQCLAPPGGLALFRAFCQWKIEHQVIKSCGKGLILRNMTGRERDAGLCTKVVTSSSVASPKCVSGGGGKYF